MDRLPTQERTPAHPVDAGSSVTSPADAGHPGVLGPVKRYRRDELTVVWEPSRCLHTGICLRTLPQVFDVGRRPWVDVDAAAADEIAAAIERCPSGALRYERPDGMPPEQPMRPTVVTVEPSGPLYVRGDVVMRGWGGGTTHTRVALCRCGNSLNKPYCDNSHRSSTDRG